jgi:hypothetical protein
LLGAFFDTSFFLWLSIQLDRLVGVGLKVRVWKIRNVADLVASFVVDDVGDPCVAAQQLRLIWGIALFFCSSTIADQSMTTPVVLLARAAALVEQESSSSSSVMAGCKTVVLCSQELWKWHWLSSRNNILNDGCDGRRWRKLQCPAPNMIL